MEAVFTPKGVTPIGPYSQAVKANGFVFVSGQIPAETDGKLIGGTTAQKTHKMCQNARAVLEAAGSSLAKVVKVTVYFQNMDDFKEMNEVYATFGANDFPVTEARDEGDLLEEGVHNVHAAEEILQEDVMRHISLHVEHAATARPLNVGTTQAEQPDQRSEDETLAENIGSATTMVEPVFQQNPLGDNDHTFASALGRYWYMGPTSSWSFCRRVFAMLGKRIPDAAPDPWHGPDRGAFHLQWTPLGANETPDVSNLPPLDYALLLFNAAKFYLGVLFLLIDEEAFIRDIHSLYENPVEKAGSSRHWFAQFLLILGYGKAFVVCNRSRSPPGYHYALAAMALLPDQSGLSPDPIQAIQSLVLAALYFQSVDMRVAAFHHIGQALRVCLVEGIHRHMPEHVVDVEHARRCNTVFWVVYILEREFGALMGVPTSLADDEITLKLPSQLDGSADAMNMALHVQLSGLTARIFTTVYGSGGGPDGSLIPNTQSILRDLARLSQDLTDLLRAQFQGSVGTLWTLSSTCYAEQTQCVVLTTRPLVMCALQMHVENADTKSSETIPLTPPVRSLLQSCVDSAQTELKMLHALAEEDLLEAAFSSAFVLYLLRVITPSLIQDDAWCNNIQDILDKMIADGSLVAPLRKVELSQLEYVMAALSPDKRNQTLSVSGDSRSLPADLDCSLSDDLLNNPIWDVFDTDTVTGLLPEELMELADRLDAEFVPVSS
ncbi:proline dehydrogenase [Purpureocillium lavendulum]|uniref:Proline dehydrogenase n=1 Tax=Purpureocillium lavendulum TaxID=1247861 RepID=A0AB34G139_9HYPO|nr:proline dehydrogenase [Purpureocillium lavendulum]